MVQREHIKKDQFVILRFLSVGAIRTSANSPHTPKNVKINQLKEVIYELQTSFD